MGMNVDACLPPALARIVGRDVAMFLGVPADWATAIAINPGAAGTVCARFNKTKHIVRCAPCVSKRRLDAWLQVAAEKGHLDVVQYLCELPLERGVDPAAHNSRPVQGAARGGHLAVVQYLCELPLDCGVDLAIFDNWALPSAVILT